MRKTFQVDSVELISDLLLDVDYDDAFIAYLNGVEIARSTNLITSDAIYVTAEHEAQLYQGGLPEPFPVSAAQLIKGANLLAVVVYNISSSSSDLSSNVFLHAQIQGDTLIYNETPDWFQPPVSFTSSNLPILKITTNGQDIPDEPKIAAHLGVINNGAGALNYVTDTFADYNGLIGIEIRGQSSQMFPKKSYGFETRDSLGENLNVSLLGMPKENDWILYAPYSDKSMLRNVVTFELARKLGHYCSRVAFCELVINNTYQGVYVLMEKIKKDDERVDVSTLNPDEISGDDLTGGYIFKVDKTDDGFYEGYTGWTSSPNPSYPNAMDIIFQHVYPKPDEIADEQREYLKSTVTEFEDVLIGYNFNDPNSGYNSYLNTGSFIDFMIMSELSKEVDKYRYSNYFYKKKESKGGELFAGPIWDFNLGYANVDYWPYGLETNGWLYTDVQPVDWSIMYWWKRLMEDSYFKQLAASRWKSLREDEFSDANITYLFDSLTMELSDAQERNYKRWPILGTYVWPNYNWVDNTYADEVAYFKNWLMDRLTWMDNNIGRSYLNPAVELTQVLDADNFKRFRVTLSDEYFNNKDLKKKHFILQSVDTSAYIEDLEYINANTAIVWVGSNYPEVLVDNDLTLTVSEKTLNGFEALTSNAVLVSIPEMSLAEQLQVKISGYQNLLRIVSNRPDLLPQQALVYNKLGQLVQVLPLTQQYENTFNMNLSKDIYFVQLIGENMQVSQQVYLSIGE